MANSKLLLTSGGITNELIQDSLVDLLGKPINEASALFVPTAIYAYPFGIQHTWHVIKGPAELGWKSFGLLELTALPSLPQDLWQARLFESDVIIVGGGNKFYLSYWMKRSGLFDQLPEWLGQGKVYVGISAGSMMMTPQLNYDPDRLNTSGTYFDDEFNEEMPSTAGSATTLGLVDFVIRPHLGAEYFPQVTLENMQKWAAKVDHPLYGLDDQSAIEVVDGKVKVVSDGKWILFE
jgi:dipeptidase E